MRLFCSGKGSRCIVIALMSFFIMGFQFMPNGGSLSNGDRAALSEYASALSKDGVRVQKAVGTGQDSGTSVRVPWTNIKFTLPHVDFGFDSLYGLDQ